MSFRNILTSILISFVLVACTSIKYQAQEDAIEGYSDKNLGDNVYEVSFQTYREGSHLSEVKNLALKRAAEISLKYKKPFFIIISEKSETKGELVTIPEQKMLSFIGSSPSLNGASTAHQEVETIIPAYNKEFTIQKVILDIKLLSNYEDGAFTASQN